ncbi:MAG: glycosyltransferase [Planctomycetota bacterium]|jgi:glycosyltransferase involved in cell wall biosynthesis
MPSDRQLTVVHISTRPDFYGGENLALLTMRGTVELGHRCLALARRGGEFAQRARDEGYDVGTFRGNGRDPVSIWRIRRRLAALKPDVVHFEDAHAVTSGGLAALGLGIRARVAARRCEYVSRVPAKYRYLCDAIIADSRSVAESCYAAGLPRDRVHVIHDGVDPGRARSGSRQRGRRALDLGDDDVLLLTIASLERAKGHTDLLQALPRVFADHPRAVVALAGDGALRDTLLDESRRLDIDDRVRFLGYRDDVPDLLHAADLLLHPSRVEPLGSSLIDAMLARAAIVTTTTGGIPELVGPIDGEPAVAFLAPPADPTALADAILEALGSPQQRREMVERAEQRAVQRFTAETMVRDTVAVYRHLLTDGE